jgi:hypothetical protein
MTEDERKELDRLVAQQKADQKRGFDTRRKAETLEIFEGRVSAFTPPAGLVSRRGYERVIPSGNSADASHLEELVEIASKVLQGRNAAVFEALALGPLLGKPKKTVRELAEQFNVNAARIYRILSECWRKVAAEKEKRKK